MGARAQEAVLFHSKQTGEYLRLLGILAAGTDDSTGLIDPAPKRETLASWTNVTTRTITNRIQRIIDDGELELVRLGSGPGNPSAYRLLLPIPEVTLLQTSTPPAKGEKESERVKDLEQRVKDLEQTVAEMGEKMAQFFALSPEKGETKGEKWGRKGEKGENEGTERAKRVKGKGERGQSSSVQTILLDPNTFDPEEINDDDGRARAEAAAVELLDYWQDLTGSFAPADDEKRAREYIGPLNRLWIKTGRDVEAAKRLLREKRTQMLHRGKTPYRPAAIVPQIFDELDGVANARASPNGHHEHDPLADRKRRIQERLEREGLA